jgi:NADH dehydrogenase
MPVIVIGADTGVGAAVVSALSGRPGEVRAFVTDAGAVGRLRALGARVAVGDVTDPGHLAGAAHGCFTAVLVAGAAGDERPGRQGSDPDPVLRIWAEVVAAAGVRRAIWVGSMPAAGPRPEEFALVDPGGRPPAEVAAEVAELDDRDRI